MVTATQRDMDHTLMVARLYEVPLDMIMHRDMLDNWRRRTKRLERAIITAARAGDHTRVETLHRARWRLTTGRHTP